MNAKYSIGAAPAAATPNSTPETPTLPGHVDYHVDIKVGMACMSLFDGGWEEAHIVAFADSGCLCKLDDSDRIVGNTWDEVWLRLRPEDRPRTGSLADWSGDALSNVIHNLGMASGELETVKAELQERKLPGMRVTAGALDYQIKELHRKAAALWAERELSPCCGD